MKSQYEAKIADLTN